MAFSEVKDLIIIELESQTVLEHSSKFCVAWNFVGQHWTVEERPFRGRRVKGASKEVWVVVTYAVSSNPPP